MLKLLKHEIKGRYRNFLIMLVGLFFANLLIIQIANTATELKDIIVWKTMAVLLNFGGIIMVLIDGLRLLSRDIYTETGYTIFMLPLKAYTILISKVILTVLEMTGVLIAIRVIVSITNKIPFGSIKQNLIILGIILAFYIGILIIVYFAQVIGKLSMGDSGYARLIAVILTFAITYGVVYIDQFFSDKFPASLTLLSIEYTKYPFHPFKIQANIASFIFEVCLALGLFIFTTYLVDKKIDI